MISSPIDEIKSRLNIVEVIGSYIKLQKTGANFRALCPFHSEKKPSFFVSPGRQIWHCFGCSVGGGIFDFVMKIEGVEFGDALRILAQKAGVELKPMRPELKTERQRLYEICELATCFFEKQLEKSSTGREAKKYLLSRGISEDSIKKWRLGYAPDVWQGLSDFLIGRGYKKEEIERAGLSSKSEMTGNFFDRFRGRIIFPIFDLNSQIIGFGGRVFGEKSEKEIAKYVNTPSTLLYDKSRILYGLAQAKVEIRKKDSCILVEGYTDVILAHQAGFENVVATSGTALSLWQLKILKRYSENLTTAFDMDVAGNTATKRGIDLAQLEGFNIKVVLLPEGSDPADIISQNQKNWEKLIAESRSILDFYFETTFSKLDSKMRSPGGSWGGWRGGWSPDGKKEISKILLPVIKRIPNKIVQAHWIQTLAEKLDVKDENVEAELKKITLTNFGRDFNLPPQPLVEKPCFLKNGGRKELLEERLVTLILKSPENLTDLSEEDFKFFSPQTFQLLSHFKKNPTLAVLSAPVNYEGFPPELIDFLNYLSLKAEMDSESLEGSSEERKESESGLPAWLSSPPEINTGEEFRNCLKEIKCLEIKKRLNEISKEIKEAEEEKDIRKTEGLIQKFKDIAGELINL